MSATLYIYIAFVCYIVPILMPLLPTFFWEINLVWGVFYLLALVFVIQAATRRPGVKFANIWTLILAFYFLLVLASISWTRYYSYDLYTFERIYARFLAPLVMATIALNIFNRKNCVELYVKNFMLAAAILALIGMVHLALHDLSGAEQLRAGAGTLKNPNALAIFLVLSIPCILYAIERRILPRILSWTIMITVIAGVISTVSRKGITTMVIAFLVYFTLKRQFRMVVTIVFVGFILAALLVKAPFISRRFTPESLRTNLDNKVTMVIAGWNMFKDHPLIGLGYNGYYENFGNYVPTFGRAKYDAHNIYITELANRGVLGFIVFISIFIYPLIVSMGNLNRHTSVHKRHMAVISISSILPFMVSGYFAGGLFWGWFTVFVLYTHISFIFCASASDDSAQEPLPKSASSVRT